MGEWREPTEGEIAPKYVWGQVIDLAPHFRCKTRWGADPHQCYFLAVIGESQEQALASWEVPVVTRGRGRGLGVATDGWPRAVSRRPQPWSRYAALMHFFAVEAFGSIRPAVLRASAFAAYPRVSRCARPLRYSTFTCAPASGPSGGKPPSTAKKMERRGRWT